MNDILVAKYNKAIPRYTSYPPVPNWKYKEIDEDKWFDTFLDDLQNTPNQELSIYIHLPFCEQLCTYCGCNKRITKRHEVESPYIQSLKQEWSLYVSKLGFKPTIKYIHLGGGTPTFFDAANLEDLLSFILANATLAVAYQFSFEGHPNNTTFSHLETLKRLGFNRVSYGVQDFSLVVQKAIHRIQPVENVSNVVEWSRQLGYESINFDLVYGLPFQTIESIHHTIEQVSKFKPERIALYSYAHVPWVSKSQRGYNEADLPSADEKLGFYLSAKEGLERLGYVAIGMDHFALPTDELALAKSNRQLHRNFMGYTADNASCMIGLGCSSISSSKHAFVQNEKSVEDYQNRLNSKEFAYTKGHILSEEEATIDTIISALICNGRFDFSQAKVFSDNFIQALPKLLALETDELIKLDNKTVAVTALGMLFVRNICAVFDVHLKETEQRMFSQSV